ncbi:MAG: hypothetical protein UU85_C0001G0086 [Candidatus Wolfebacteria bacterium GW2011_GWA2_42_10]|uniref:Uncharacterized protein n=2 Tax=Candidatus Wolfeibacteriota TaxID=1752735 RepID=A0A0G0ZUJ2_9BACT|nr:MAG: hypothetical protein UU38_C0003G0151 [Candidatus Wolfebacteria bacterium GW2011_GWB1_41_12]KKS25656.1 MAG: hypothetical protein UU85_C0001G0086 [Candidatus Wolfebacteria bacterium GW2011_GWA2_42_10]KKT56455.1 MAG: hypothetical protein UW50_C0001G0022 [Candidatus Wolfebacteria bacterium GW2011_GWA1_44_24]
MEDKATGNKVTAIGTAFLRAVKKKEKEQKPLPTFNLKEIEELKVPEITEEELRASEIEAKERKEAAQILAAKGLDIERKIREIEKVPDWQTVPSLIETHGKLLSVQKKIEELIKKDDVLAESHKVSRLIKEIMAENPENPEKVIKWILEVEKAGRGKLVKETHENRYKAVVFNGYCLIHIPSEFYPEGVSPADKKIFYELRKFIDRCNNHKISKLLEKGNPNLFSLRNGIPGIYRIYFPERTDRKGKRWQKGVGIVKVANLNEKSGKPFFVVGVVDGAGSLDWLSSYTGNWVPLAAGKTGKVLEDKTPANKLEFSRKFAKMLCAACDFYDRSGRE